MPNQMHVALVTQGRFQLDRNGNYSYEGSHVERIAATVDPAITLAEFEQVARTRIPSLGAKPLRMRYLFPVADGICHPVDITNDEHFNNFKKYASTIPKSWIMRVFIDPVGKKGINQG